jgi:hypothetical protein
MRINRLRIENFRSIKLLDLELGQNTVFIGQNNAGKTAILDALRIALTRRWGQRGTGFTEYDIHLDDESDDPKQSPGLAIEVRTEESEAGEWPDELQQSLEDILQVDAVTGRAFVVLRATCAWSEVPASWLKSHGRSLVRYHLHSKSKCRGGDSDQSGALRRRPSLDSAGDRQGIRRHRRERVYRRGRRIHRTSDGFHQQREGRRLCRRNAAELGNKRP